MCSLSCYSFLLHSHLTLPSLSLPRFSGKVEVWIIEDFKLQPVSPAKYVMLSYLPVPHGSCMNMTDSLTHSSCTFPVTIDLSNPPPFLLFSFPLFSFHSSLCAVTSYPTPPYPIPPYPRYGQFYGGDSYVVLYTYMKGNKQEHIIYFWLGHTSSKDEIGIHILPLISSHLLHLYSPVSVFLSLPFLTSFIINLSYPMLSYLPLISFPFSSLLSSGSAALLAAQMDREIGGRPVEVGDLCDRI